MKTCSRCKGDKSLAEFSANKRSTDGLNRWCRSCSSDYLRSYKERRARGEDTSKVKVNVTPGVKRCPSCEQNKAVEEFGRNASSASGLSTYCRPCTRERERQKWAADPSINERKVAQHREWLARNPDKVQAINERRRPKTRVARRAYYKTNREAELAKAKQRRQENPEIYKAIDLRRYARKRGTEVNDFTPAQWLELLEEFDHHCAYCGERPERLEQEHMTPLSRGGAHTKDNIVPACRRCNIRKHTKTAWEFLGMDWFEVIDFAPPLELAGTGGR